MPNKLTSGQSDPAYVSSGYLSQKNIILEMDVEGNRIRIENAEDMSLTYTVNTEDVVFLGSTVTQHFPTHASISGSITIHTTHATWLDIVSQHSRLGNMPSVNFRVAQPPTTIQSTMDPSIMNSKPDMGEFSFTLFNVVFTDLPLINFSASSGAVALKATIPFTANGIVIHNTLKGSELFKSTRSR